MMLIKCLLRCRLSVDQWAIKDINQHLTIDAFSKHNPHCVQFDKNKNNNSLFTCIVDNRDICFFNRILNDAVYNFPNNQEEITLCVCPETFKVKNYVDDEPGKKWKYVMICTWLVAVADLGEGPRGASLPPPPPSTPVILDKERRNDRREKSPSRASKNCPPPPPPPPPPLAQGE